MSKNKFERMIWRTEETQLRFPDKKSMFSLCGIFVFLTLVAAPAHANFDEFLDNTACAQKALATLRKCNDAPKFRAALETALLEKIQARLDETANFDLKAVDTLLKKNDYWYHQPSVKKLKP